MVFSRLFFIYLFFPICFLCYFATKKTSYRNAVLIVFSLLFYACGDISFLWLVVASALVNFVLGRGIDKFRDKAPAKAFLALGLVLNLGTLVGFKYTGFFIENLNNWFSLSIPVPDLPLPLGISFFTFRTVSYLIDCAWGKVKAERNFFTFLLYVSFFPITISGPIARYETMQADLHQRRVSADDLSIGFGRIAVGLSKKVILADRLSGIVDQFLGNDFTTQTTLGVWYGVILYALQMYFDFSGYSDMAIGLGLMFGFRFLENFNYPYISKSITEFWRRWHISLATWFKLYLYIPLGGNRKGAVRTYWNLFAVFLVTGIWHGAAWSYVAWGIWNGIFIVIERFFGLDKDKNDRWYVSAAKHVYAFFAIVWGMIIFRAESLSYAYEYICRMLHIDVTKHLPDYDYGVNNKFAIMLIVGLICAMPVCRNLIYIKYEHKVQRTLVNIWLFLLFFWSTISLAASTYNPFIYFRF